MPDMGGAAPGGAPPADDPADGPTMKIRLYYKLYL